MRKIVRYMLFCVVSVFFVACSNHADTNNAFEKALVEQYCSDSAFEPYMEKITAKDDVIYTGLNAGLIARSCGEFERSNFFFDSAEDSYKDDVDLQSFTAKGSKLAATTLVNEGVVDYEGSLYERIMLNAYKGLNFMSLGDFENARVEFNRALMRQDKAKEYFAKQIERNREELQESQNAEDSKENEKNIGDNLETVTQQYNELFTAFETTKDFVNPYATYLASVFFFMEHDYRRAGDLFREVAIINKTNKEITKESKIFAQHAQKAQGTSKRYVFVVYENGLGVVKDSFELTLPFVVSKSVVTASVAFPTLQKRESSYPHILANGMQTTMLTNLDDIVATEFKIALPAMITKALTASLVKTTLNVAVAKNDATGGWLTIASNVATKVATKADVRSWRGLPKSVSVVMIENTGKLKLVDSNGTQIAEKKLDKNKNAFVVVRSYAPDLPSSVQVIQK